MIYKMHRVFITPSDEMSIHPPHTSTGIAQEVYTDVRYQALKSIRSVVYSKPPTSGLFIIQDISDLGDKLSLVGFARTSDVKSGDIKLHELTRVEKEVDMVDHFLDVMYQVNPVQLVADLDSVGVYDIMKSCITKSNLMRDYQVSPSRRVKIYKVPDDEADLIEDLSTTIDSLYVADGHHRVNSYVRMDNEYGLCPLFLVNVYDKKDINLMPYNRIVITDKVSSELLFDELHPYDDSADFHVIRDGSIKSGYNNKKSDQLLYKLPSYYVDQYILPKLGIINTRTSNLVKFIDGDMSKLKQVRNNLQKSFKDDKEVIAIYITPPSIDDIIQIADQKLIIPPKSTWFEPKIDFINFIFSI